MMAVVIVKKVMKALCVNTLEISVIQTLVDMGHARWMSMAMFLVIVMMDLKVSIFSSEPRHNKTCIMGL